MSEPTTLTADDILAEARAQPDVFHPKIIFLDFDGVLNNTASIMEQVHLLPDKVRLVNILCDLTGAKIVVSSAWRDFMSDDRTDCKVLFALSRAGLGIHHIIGRTSSGFRGRGKEINDWLACHRPEKWVIIDDEAHDFTTTHRAHFVQTRGETGLRWKDIQKAREILADKPTG